MNKSHAPKLALVALAATVAISLAGCSAPSSLGSKSDNSKSSNSAPVAPAKPKVGTLANPAPAGTPIDTTDELGSGTASVTFTGTTFNADAAVAAENEFNSAPPAGSQYLTVTVTIKNTGTSGTVDPGVEALDYTFSTASGQSFKADADLVVLPNDLINAPTLQPGQSATGEIDFDVPTGTTAGAYGIGSVFVSAS